METYSTPEDHDVKCDRCGKPGTPYSAYLAPHSGGTGFGFKDDKRYCYTCCAELDREQMRREGKIALYLSDWDPNVQQSYGLPYIATVGNWPGTLKLPVHLRQKGRHNIARTRTDVWFVFEGREWHGVSYGENTQIVHCRATSKILVKQYREGR